MAAHEPSIITLILLTLQNIKIKQILIVGTKADNLIKANILTKGCPLNSCFTAVRFLFRYNNESFSETFNQTNLSLLAMFTRTMW